MPHTNNLGRFEFHPVASELGPKLFSLAAGTRESIPFLREALEEIKQYLAAQTVALVRAQGGRWRVLQAAGRKGDPPSELLAEALDTGSATESGTWAAAPLLETLTPNELLVVSGSQRDAGSTATTAEAIGSLLGTSLALVRTRETQQLRIERLEAILEVAAQWRETHDMEALLGKMARAATRLLDAERASIFLWDRPNKTLVGRPALGVKDNELRIADDTGIVGRVVHSGEALRVNADEDQSAINRQVDQQLGFQTKSLLCVPLRGSQGEIIGAFEMINKRSGNFSDEDLTALTELASHAALALENTQQYTRLLNSRNQWADEAAQRARMIGQSEAIEGLRTTIGRVAQTELAVLLLGENGTGKEVVARSIHSLSARRNEPFVAVNCAALTETLLESELFGHEKGAFTDAREMRAGKFELASGGILFLDEIGDMSPGGQAKLLRVLEEKVVVRVGGSLPIHTDARVIAATNQDLAQLVRERRFREDLYFRLNVVTIELPPLRQRGDDVLLLAEHFLADFCGRARRPPMQLTDGARRRLLDHDWPGNIRELRNLMERIAYLSPNQQVQTSDLHFTISPVAEPADVFESNLTLADATRNFQVEYIKRSVHRSGGNMTDAAQRLGLHRSNLYRKMRQLGMGVEEVQ